MGQSFFFVSELRIASNVFHLQKIHPKRIRWETGSGRSRDIDRVYSIEIESLEKFLSCLFKYKFPQPSEIAKFRSINYFLFYRNIHSALLVLFKVFCSSDLIVTELTFPQHKSGTLPDIIGSYSTDLGSKYDYWL